MVDFLIFLFQLYQLYHRKLKSPCWSRKSVHICAVRALQQWVLGSRALGLLVLRLVLVFLGKLVPLTCELDSLKIWRGRLKLAGQQSRQTCKDIALKASSSLVLTDIAVSSLGRFQSHLVGRKVSLGGTLLRVLSRWLPAYQLLLIFHIRCLLSD